MFSFYFVVCSLLFAVCSVHCEVCSMPCVVCSDFLEKVEDKKKEEKKKRLLVSFWRGFLLRSKCYSAMCYED